MENNPEVLKRSKHSLKSKVQIDLVCNKKSPTRDSWGNFLFSLRTWPCNTFVGIHNRAYTIDRHKLKIGIPLLQEW